MNLMPLHKAAGLFSGQTYYHGLGTEDVIFQIVQLDGTIFVPESRLIVEYTMNTLNFFTPDPEGGAKVPYFFTTSKITVVG